MKTTVKTFARWLRAQVASSPNPNSRILMESGTTPTKYNANHPPPPSNAANAHPPGDRNAREAIGTERVHRARAAAAGTRIDCGSGYDYGICPVCKRGHGHVLIRNGQPTALVPAS